MASSRHQPIIITLFSGIAFIFLLNLVFLYYSVGDKVWIFYNSDSLYLPYLYQDLVLRHGKLSEWIFSPTPYFFPDTLIYFILATVSQHLKLSIILYAITQFALYYWLIIAIGKKILKNPNDIVLFHLSVLISLLLLSKGYLQQETLIMGLISQSHFGTALIFLLGILLILNTFSSQSIWNYFFLFIVCFITTFSDILFLTQFFIPAILSLGILWFFSNNPSIKKVYLKNIGIINFGCLGSYLLYKSKILPIHVGIYMGGLQRYHLTDLINATQKMFFNFSVFYQSNALILIFLNLYMVLAIHYLIKAFKYRVSDSQNNLVILLLFSSIIIGILSLLFIDNNLMAKNFISLRHCIPFIIFPVFLGIPIFLAVYTHLGKYASNYYMYIVIAILGYAYSSIPQGASISNILNFYPESTACLDTYADKYHLKNGVTYFFWEARSNSFLSKKDLNIVNVKFDLSSGPIPRLYFNTLHDFKNKDFTFLLVSNFHLADPDFLLKMNQFKKKFGEASFAFICPSWDDKKNTVFVYETERLNKDWNDGFFKKLVNIL